MKTATSKKSLVIEVFESFNEPVSAPVLAAECLRRNVWSKEERDKLAFRGVADRVRKILNEHDPDGTPVALIRDVSIEEGDDGRIKNVQVFVQRELWNLGDARNWLCKRVSQIRDDWEKVKRTVEYFIERWPSEDWWAIASIRVEEYGE